jgi:hypothetical protein
MARRVRRLYGLVGLCVCGAWRIDRNESRASGACFNESGTSCLRVNGGADRVGGWMGGVDPFLSSQLRTSDTFETKGSSLGFREEVYCRRCHMMPSSSR